MTGIRSDCFLVLDEAYTGFSVASRKKSCWPVGALPTAVLENSGARLALEGRLSIPQDLSELFGCIM